eukprot:1566941-Pyramimonas_sp.AAC.1
MSMRFSNPTGWSGRVATSWRLPASSKPIEEDAMREFRQARWAMQCRIHDTTRPSLSRKHRLRVGRSVAKLLGYQVLRCQTTLYIIKPSSVWSHGP